MSDLNSMWFCPECDSWVGTEIETCFVCETERPLLPVTSEQVPVDDSKQVTSTHRLRAKIERLTGVGL